MYDFGRDFAARVAAKQLSSVLGRYVEFGVTVKENMPRYAKKRLKKQDKDRRVKGE